MSAQSVPTWDVKLRGSEEPRPPPQSLRGAVDFGGLFLAVTLGKRRASWGWNRTPFGRPVTLSPRVWQVDAGHTPSLVPAPLPLSRLSCGSARLQVCPPAHRFSPRPSAVEGFAFQTIVMCVPGRSPCFPSRLSIFMVSLYLEI